MTEHSVQLDHVVLLLPYKDISDPPGWLTNNFVVSPGGKHADGRTENRLILFADGTYLELIAFVNDDPDKRRGHWWDKPYGIVDFALATIGEFNYTALKQRLAQTHTGISYAEPQEGGRLTADGKEVRWKVTFPTGAERGAVPFWCQDVTARERRVPVTDANTKHPCGARGMAGVRLEMSQDRMESLQKAISAIVDSKQQVNGHHEIGAPKHVEGIREPTIQLNASREHHDVKLSLVLRTLDTPPPAALEHKIGNGMISIEFET